MTQYPFRNAVFVKTALKPRDYPVLKSDSGKELPEIAVAGRSNVGKSSLLNDVFQSHSLVKTSSAPGKTQALNFFRLDDLLSFVDLPGYGYAKVPLEVRKNWGPMVQTYLEKRETVKLILFLFDIRRLPNEEDKQFIEWAAHYQKSLILVLTKVDKVTANEKRANALKILKAFDVENLHYVLYSVPKKQGRQELIKMLIEAVETEQREAEHGSDR